MITNIAMFSTTEMIARSVPLAKVAADSGPSLLAELGLFLPLWILVLGSVALLLSDAFAQRREAGFQRGMALVIVALAGLAAWSGLGDESLEVGSFALSGALLSDRLALLLDLLALAALAGVVGMAREHGAAARSFGEREPLLLLAGAGALACIHAGDLIVLWLGLELLTMAALVSMLASTDALSRSGKREALIAQWLPAALSSCLMLLGVALIYAGAGGTGLERLGSEATRVFARWGSVQRWVSVVERFGPELAEHDPAGARMAHSEIVRGLAPAALLLPGLVLLLLGVIAKLGLLPLARRQRLHEEGPVHLIALWSTLGVVACTSILLRVFVGILHSPRLVNPPYGWTGSLTLLALLTGVGASLAALRQRRLSKMVALLCLVQVSLLLLGVVAAANFYGHIGVGGRELAPELERLWSRGAGDAAFGAVLTLLFAHVIAALGCFAAIAASRGFRGPEVRVQHWAGMAMRRPWLAFSFALCLLALVGVPPLAGFAGKLALFQALMEHSGMRWVSVVVALELSICVWVVLRTIVTMVSGAEALSEPGEREEPSPWPARVAWLAALASIAMGLGAQHMQELIRVPAATGAFKPGDPQREAWLEDRREAWALDAERLAAPPRGPELEVGDEDQDPLEAEASQRKMSLEPGGS